VPWNNQRGGFNVHKSGKFGGVRGPTRKEGQVERSKGTKRVARGKKLAGSAKVQTIPKWEMEPEKKGGKWAKGAEDGGERKRLRLSGHGVLESGV